MANKNIIISDNVLQFLDTYSLRFLPKETGGILLGFEDDKNIYITHATEAGEDAVHKKQEFIRDARYSKKILNEIYKNTSGKCDYIGEWHSHPENSSISLLDKISLFSLAMNPFNNVRKPLLLININTQNGWKQEVYQYIRFKVLKKNIK